jgi:hypothetical protein
MFRRYIDNTSWDITSWDRTTRDKTYCRQNVQWTKRPEGQNVLRDKTSSGTKHPQGQNVLRNKTSLGLNILRNKTSSGTKYPEKKHPNTLPKRPVTLKKLPNTMKKKWRNIRTFCVLGTVKHIRCYISVSTIDIWRI